MAAPPSRTIMFEIRGPLTREELPALYRRVCILLEQSGASVAVCEVSDVAADAVSVDALARLQLAARRHRCQVQLRNASSELRGLIAFMGLDDVLVDEPR